MDIQYPGTITAHSKKPGDVITHLKENINKIRARTKIYVRKFTKPIDKTKYMWYNGENQTFTTNLHISRAKIYVSLSDQKGAKHNDYSEAHRQIYPFIR